MDLNEALNVAKQLRNHYRVFEKLHDFVSSVISLQHLQNELKERNEVLKDEINNNTKTLALAKAEKEKILDDVKATQIRVKAEAEADLKTLEKDFSNRKAILIKNYEEEKKGMFEQIKIRGDNIATLTKRIKEKKGLLDKLEVEVQSRREDLKDILKGLGGETDG
jgi:chromosome segregation ATPase